MLNYYYYCLSYYAHDKDGKLYTGPVALLNRPGAGSDVDQKWRYFALKKFDENLVLKQNQQVLFEVSNVWQRMSSIQ